MLIHYKTGLRFTLTCSSVYKRSQKITVVCGCDYYLDTRLHCQTMVLCKLRIDLQSQCIASIMVRLFTP